MLGRAIVHTRRRCIAGLHALEALDERGTLPRVTIIAALLGLAIHVSLVTYVRFASTPAPLLAGIGTNYLAALYTPFSFVLFYEVMLLILAIPASTTKAIGKQYEVLSLVVIRNVFKDIAEFESVINLGAQLDEFQAVLLDLGGGLLMFMLVTVFNAIDRRRQSDASRVEFDSTKVEQFVGRKQVIALTLTAVMLGLAVFSLISWTADVITATRAGMAPQVDIEKVFYVELFSVMIFADAILLLLSLELTHHYGIVFRNAAFIASTVLLRFAIAGSKPYDIVLGLLAIAGGTLVLLTYRMYMIIDAGELAGPNPGSDPSNA